MVVDLYKQPWFVVLSGNGAPKTRHCRGYMNSDDAWVDAKWRNARAAKLGLNALYEVVVNPDAD